MSFCKIRQFRISSALDDVRPLPPSIFRHLESCECCRDFYKRSQSIGDELSAAPVSTETPPWLSTRIMAQVQASSQERAPALSPLVRWLPAVTGVAAIAIVAMVIFASQKEPASSVVDEDGGVEPPAPVEETTPGVYALTTPVHPANVPAKLEEHAKGALSKEAQHLASDLRGARRFLTASFRSTIPGMGSD